MAVVICVNQPLNVDKLLLCAYISVYFNCITFIVCIATRRDLWIMEYEVRDCVL
jgi:hypothetical protein